MYTGGNFLCIKYAVSHSLFQKRNRVPNPSTGSRHLSEIWQKFLFGILPVLLFLESLSPYISHYSKSGQAKRKRHSYTTQMTQLARERWDSPGYLFDSILIFLGKAREALTVEVATLKPVSSKSWWEKNVMSTILIPSMQGRELYCWLYVPWRNRAF